jgi:hypothetical protein
LRPILNCCNALIPAENVLIQIQAALFRMGNLWQEKTEGRSLHSPFFGVCLVGITTAIHQRLPPQPVFASQGFP